MFSITRVLALGLPILAAAPGVVVLEAHDGVLIRATEMLSRIPGTFVLENNRSLTAVFVWRSLHPGDTERGSDGITRPWDYKCAGRGIPPGIARRLTSEERAAVERSSFVSIIQLRNLDDCLMNEQSGEQVIRFDDFCKTAQRIRCSEARPILVKYGYSKTSIDRVMAELAARPAGWGADAGVDAPDAGRELPREGEESK